MAYRDAVARCPQCRAEMIRRATRDVWRCQRCGGVQLAELELERRLQALDPRVAAEVLFIVHAASRRATSANAAGLPCATCERAMISLAVGDSAMSRCAASSQLWIPRDDLDRLTAWALQRHRASASWLGRLLAYFYAS